MPSRIRLRAGAYQAARPEGAAWRFAGLDASVPIDSAQARMVSAGRPARTRKRPLATAGRTGGPAYESSTGAHAQRPHPPPKQLPARRPARTRKRPLATAGRTVGRAFEISMAPMLSAHTGRQRHFQRGDQRERESAPSVRARRRGRTHLALASSRGPVQRPHSPPKHFPAGRPA